MIGPKMVEVVEYVAKHPGCTQQAVARHVGPNGSHKFGARSVQRALAAGLVENKGTVRKYSLEVLKDSL